MKRSISSSVFQHISRCTSASSIWQTLDRLFNKKNKAQLQLLETELTNAKQEESSIFEFFMKMKNLCSGLRVEYIPLGTSIQGWVEQPSLEELEFFLNSQELLAI